MTPQDASLPEHATPLPWRVQERIPESPHMYTSVYGTDPRLHLSPLVARGFNRDEVEVCVCYGPQDRGIGNAELIVLAVNAFPYFWEACRAVADAYPLDEVINDIPEHVRLCLVAIAKATRKRS